MKNLVVLFLISTLLNAQNPKVYAALGDIIYDNAPKIEKLKDLTTFASSVDKINQYINDVNTSKEYGFLLDAGDMQSDKLIYLKKLRGLVKTNDYFVRSVKSKFKVSMDTQDHLLFSATVNSGLIDTEKNKSEIVNYYLEHSDDINASGIIQEFLDKDEALRKEKEARLKNRAIEKDIKESQEAKIKRLRKNDKEKQEVLKKSLEEEVFKKKSAIRENLIKELSN